MKWGFLKLLNIKLLQTTAKHTSKNFNICSTFEQES